MFTIERRISFRVKEYIRHKEKMWIFCKTDLAIWLLNSEHNLYSINSTFTLLKWILCALFVLIIQIRKALHEMFHHSCNDFVMCSISSGDFGSIVVSPWQISSEDLLLVSAEIATRKLVWFDCSSWSEFVWREWPPTFLLGRCVNYRISVSYRLRP